MHYEEPEGVVWKYFINYTSGLKVRINFCSLTCSWQGCAPLRHASRIREVQYPESLCRSRKWNNWIPYFPWHFPIDLSTHQRRQWSNLKRVTNKVLRALVQNTRKREVYAINIIPPWIIARRITMTKKKNVMSNMIRYTSYSSPSGDSISSPIPPPARTPLYKWKTKHWK